MECHVKEVEAALLKKWIDKGEVILIDVREHLEYYEEHIPKAQFFPLSQFDPHVLPDPSGKKLIFYCHIGRRSAHAALKWSQHGGLAKAYTLRGGITSWKEEGFPTLVNQEASGKIEKQAYIVCGILLLLSIALAFIFSYWFLAISVGIALFLIFSGLSGHSYLTFFLSKLPWNK